MKVDVAKQRRNHRALRSPLFRFRPLSILEYAGPQPFLDEAEDPSIPDAMLEKLDHPFVRKRSIAVTDVGIQHPTHLLPHESRPRARPMHHVCYAPVGNRKRTPRSPLRKSD